MHSESCMLHLHYGLAQKGNGNFGAHVCICKDCWAALEASPWGLFDCSPSLALAIASETGCSSAVACSARLSIRFAGWASYVSACVAETLVACQASSMHRTDSLITTGHSPLSLHGWDSMRHHRAVASTVQASRGQMLKAHIRFNFAYCATIAVTHCTRRKHAICKYTIAVA